MHDGDDGGDGDDDDDDDDDDATVTMIIMIFFIITTITTAATSAPHPPSLACRPPHTRCSCNKTALQWAVQNNHTSIAELLRQYGAR